MVDSMILTDRFDRFREIIFCADTLCDPGDRSVFIKHKLDLIRDIFSALHRAGSWIYLGVTIRTLARESEKSPVPVMNWRQSKEICEALDANEEFISEELAGFCLERAKRLKEDAEFGEFMIKYTDRHRLVESAIRLVWERFSPGNRWPFPAVLSEKNVYRFIAECYLLRSRLAFPKGAAIPEKKIEALDKAWEWANIEPGRQDRSGENGPHDMDETRIGILLERERWDETLPKKWIKEKYIRFFRSNDSTLDFSNPVHWHVNDRIRELAESGDDQDLIDCLAGYDNQIMDNGRGAFSSGGSTTNWKINIPLFRARAANRLGVSELERGLKRAVDSLKKVPLSHYLWNDAVDLIQEASKKKRYKGQWEDPAITAWRNCAMLEERIGLSIKVRWYWARYRTLYDLALRAAINRKDPLLAVEIADSHKSRPTIKMLELESTLKGIDLDLFQKMIEADALFATDGFMPGMDELKNIPRPSQRGLRPFEEVPSGWAAVHFYIIDKDEAYAIIIRNGSQESMRLEISETWKAFRSWENERRDFSIHQANSVLEILCKKSGRMLSPVLDAAGADNLLFIPHGFLHLVPLHASLDGDGSPLSTNRSCMFLPSWSQAPIISAPPPSENNIILSNLPDEFVREVVETDVWNNSKRVENSPVDVFDVLSELEDPPRLLVLLCHAMGDWTNPYLARFLLKDGPLTHQDLLYYLPDLSGSRVLLTACETDLASGNTGLADEHLSLANAFLGKGADEVAGCLYKCDPEAARELVSEAANAPDRSLNGIVGKKQQEWHEEGLPLFKIAVFRVMGFPRE